MEVIRNIAIYISSDEIFCDQHMYPLLPSGNKRNINGLPKENKMSKIVDEVKSANADYVTTFGDKGDLPMPPGRQFAILTCMDARLDPAKYAGLAEGDAHVIRNAGGRASDDAIRSLVISYKLLGTKEWFVIHHTDCGMETFSTEIMADLLSSSLKTSSVDASGWHDSKAGGGTTDGKYINWLTISDQDKSVLEDVQRIRGNSMVPREIPIYGYIYDCKTGNLNEVLEATEAGKAS
jgi:carbonic anhydrase